MDNMQTHNPEMGRKHEATRKISKKKWIQKAISHPGALKKELHVKLDKKIPVRKLNKATHSKNPVEKKRAVLAKTLRKFKK